MLKSERDPIDRLHRFAEGFTKKSSPFGKVNVKVFDSQKHIGRLGNGSAGEKRGFSGCQLFGKEFPLRLEDRAGLR